MRLALLAIAFAFVLALGGAGCRSNSPDGRAEAACVEDCEAHAHARCNDTECIRGCKFSLDRLLEHEGRNVVACIGRGKGACDDPAWAECAANIGVHVDGGPPGPRAPGSEDTTDNGTDTGNDNDNDNEL